MANTETESYGPLSDYWYRSRSVETNSGKDVTVEGAMAVSAVFAATRILAETVAMLPIWMYERRPDGGKRPAPEHPLFDVLHDQPNEKQTAMEWVEHMTSHAVLRGKAYSLITPGRRGTVGMLSPLATDRMEEKHSEDGRIHYEYRTKKNEKISFEQDEIFQLNGFGGVSVVEHARESIGLALAAEEHGARFFKQGMEAPFALKHPGTLSKQAAERLREGVSRKYSGVENHFGILLLEEGMEAQKLGLTPEDSQYIASRKFQLTEIARWFRIPPHMLADLERSTYSNIEHQGLEFVMYSLLPWIVRWKQAIRRDLIQATGKYFADFKIEQLLRGDIKSRYEAYRIAIEHGILNPNEVRELENWNPRDGGNVYWMPLNFTVSGGGDAAQQTAREREALAENRGQLLSAGVKVALNGKAREIAKKVALRLLHVEIEAIRKAALKHAGDGEAWERWVRSYYGRHAKRLIEELEMGSEAAQEYCACQTSAILENGVGILETWGAEQAEALATRALDEQGVRTDETL